MPIKLLKKTKFVNALILLRAYKTLMKDETLREIGALVAAKQIIKASIKTHRNLAETYREIANFLLNAGQPEAAQAYYELSLNIAVDQLTYSLYLQCLLLSPSCTEQRMLAVASKYDKLFLSDIQQHTRHSNDLNPNKLLKIGYVCHFFHNSVSLSLLVPFLKAHDNRRVQIYCYSDADSNEVPASIKAIPHTWRDTKEMDDTQLSARIRDDQIDVLLEMNGHCLNNRYGVIARKSAPVQISFYNHCATTGVSSFDYSLLGDEFNLNASQPYYTESLYHFKGVSGVAIFPASFPACSPAPFLKNKYITFGSFGAAHKVNSDVIKIWCDILHKVPTAKFYMKAAVLSHQAYRDVYEKMFRDHGIDSYRIHLEGYSEHHAMLDCYSKMDIALDSFPYAAGTTTMEALWQGVPVITLAGNGYASQNGKMILLSVNHPELVTNSREEYVNKAIELANNPAQLTKYRDTLRNDFKNSPRADAAAFANSLENAFIDMWTKYCTSQKETSLSC